MDEDRLDFEDEDQLLTTPRPATKRRKLIELDELVNDCLTERKKRVKGKDKKVTKWKGYPSDDEDDGSRNNERILSTFVDDCQKQMNEITSEDTVCLWGQKIFGNQRPPPPLHLANLENSELLRSLAKDEVKSLMEMMDGEAIADECIVEGLLRNGWLLKLAFVCGFVDDSVATWTFHKLLYSSDEELQVRATEFWCSILLPTNEVGQLSVKLQWLPKYSQLMEALESYGYLTDTSEHDSSISKKGCEGLQHIKSWVKVLSACTQIRSFRPIFSTSELEDLLFIIIHLFLDRQLQGLTCALHECLQSIINSFSQSDWSSGCMKIAQSIAYRIPKDLNCLHIVECIPWTNIRNNRLRSQVALQMLIVCFDKKATDCNGVLELLMSMNVKDQNCDFFKLYIYLVLAENVLSSHNLTEETPTIFDAWGKYLRNCSSQITSTDWRHYASKVRNKASYLLYQKKNFE